MTPSVEDVRGASQRSAADGAIEAIINRWDKERFFEFKNALDQLQRTPGWIQLQDLLDTGRENVMKRLVEGPTLDQAGYTRALGMLAGLDLLDRIPTVVAARAESWERKLKARDEELAAKRSE